ncbi:MAG: VOC family protein [Alphaproteobacteria bacterium]
MDIGGQITFIYTRDPDASNRFYQDVLNLPLVVTQEGGCRIYRTSASAYLGVCREREGRVSNQDGLVICFVCQDVEGVHSRLADLGVEIVRPPTHSKAFGVYSCFFRDPDGHLLEVQRFDDPDWYAG